MKKITALILIIVILVCLTPAIYAYEGYNGYEGGISSGQVTGKTSYNYQEISFLSGKPIVFNGSMVLKKSSKTGTITSTYIYTLYNSDKSAKLSRALTLITTLSKKENGQTVENTVVSKISETIIIGDTVYLLKSKDDYNLSCTSLVDPRPAVNYYSGNILSTKVYQTGVGSGTLSNSNTVTVTATGSFYGYDNYWGSAEAEEISYTIESKKKKDSKVISWGGTAKVALSSSSIKKIKYVKNLPDQISFPGGNVQTQYNNNILEYSCKLPEFDSKGNPTDNMLSPTGSLKLETAPVQTRLLVADLKEIKGHWAEKDIELLCSLEVLNSSNYLKPEQLITRAEFIAAMVKAAKEVPTDPALTSKITTAKKTKTQQVISPFNDVSIKNMYFAQIDSAVKRGIVSGKYDATFSPNEGITVADAITIFIRSLGLESLSSATQAVTTFKDNDLIPSYARSSAYVAQKIGLLSGDSKGYLKPAEKLTKGRAASLLKALITYMQEGISKDYRDRFVNF